MAPVIDNGIENVRMVCDEYGRCWRERGPRRVIIERDLYNYYGRATAIAITTMIAARACSSTRQA